MRDISDLRQRQALPLGAKVLMSQSRIREWYEHWDGDVYISFSGGKDSTVLAHIVHDIYPDVPMVFCNTGLEYPEIQAFAKEAGAEFVRPKMMFSDVLSKYGYPIISKEVSQSIAEARPVNSKPTLRRSEFMGTRLITGTEVASVFQKTKWLPLCRDTQFKISHKCCSVMKKMPVKEYEKKTHRKPFIGTLTDESRMRELAWVKSGCKGKGQHHSLCHSGKSRTY